MYGGCPEEAGTGRVRLGSANEIALVAVNRRDGPVDKGLIY